MLVWLLLYNSFCFANDGTASFEGLLCNMCRSVRYRV